MKAKYTLATMLALAFLGTGCDDNTGNIGLNTLPGSDQNISGKLNTFDVITESVHTGQVYAKTNIGYVGKYTDPTFGTYQAGFLSQLNCPQGLTFPEVYQEYDAAGNKVPTGQGVKATGSMLPGTLGTDAKGVNYGNVYTTEIYLGYDEYFGDSLTACRLSIYDLSRGEQLLDLDNAYYTKIDATRFYNPADLLGSKAYTAVDFSVKDSVRRLKSYSPKIHINIKKSVGEEILKKARALGSSLYKNFTEDVFRGIYVKSDYGDGTVLSIGQVQMNVVYECFATDSITGLKLKKKTDTTADSTYFGYRTFTSTREVIQANQLENDVEQIAACIANPEWTYLKSPAGIFTQATLPISQIAEQLQGDTLNAVRLSIPIYNQSNDRKLGMSLPKSLLLIRKQEKDSFFAQNKLSDGIVSALFDASTSSTTPTQYTYNNIAKLVNNCLNDGQREAAAKELSEKGSIALTVTDASGTQTQQTVTTLAEWEQLSDWNKVLLIPVLVTRDSGTTNYYTGTTTSSIIRIQHDLKPGYARLKGGSKGALRAPGGALLYPDNVLKLEVVSTNLSGK